MPVTVKITPIIPKKKPYLWQWDLFNTKLKYYMKNTLSRELIREFEATVVGWQRKPSFVSTYSEPYGTRKQVVTLPFGRHKTKWGWIDQGTRNRTITASGSSPMRFQALYRPKTTAGGTYGGPGMKYGPWVRTYQVSGHSIEPRKFSERIAKKIEPKVEQKIQQLAKQVFIKI